MRCSGWREDGSRHKLARIWRDLSSGTSMMRARDMQETGRKRERCMLACPTRVSERARIQTNARPQYR